MTITQRTAWEQAFVLSQEFADRLSPEQHVLCLAAETIGPHAITNDYAGRLAALWATVVEVRT